tara:strand:+ start:677 stop:1597 length:921 start_codon:yes stop_codon:yes gene_type:complete
MKAMKKEVYQMERFTAKPKWWGNLRHKSKLKASEYLVLDVIFDKTIDWNKTTDKISISQFQKELGLSNRNIIDSLEGLKKKGLIFILGRERKVNTISIKMPSCEKFALAETGEKISQAKKPTGENFSKTGEKISPQLVKKVHTHYNRYHYTIPYICEFQKNQRENPCKEFTKKAPKQKTDRELLVISLFRKWNELSGQNIRPLEKRLSHINARLDDGFTPDQIIEAMSFVATDHWHVREGFNTIELVIRSTDQLEKKLLKAKSSVNKKTHDRANDKLAVNNNWAGANKSNIVAPNTNIDDMLGEPT